MHKFFVAFSEKVKPISIYIRIVGIMQDVSLTKNNGSNVLIYIGVVQSVMGSFQVFPPIFLHKYTLRWLFNLLYSRAELYQSIKS